MEKQWDENGSFLDFLFCWAKSDKLRFWRLLSRNYNLRVCSSFDAMLLGLNHSMGTCNSMVLELFEGNPTQGSF